MLVGLSYPISVAPPRNTQKKPLSSLIHNPLAISLFLAM